MNKIDDFIKPGLKFEAVSHLVEIFPAPIPIEIDGNDINSAEDLFRYSSAGFGFNELFVPSTSSIEANSNGKAVSFTRDEFLRWQLERFNSETIYYLITKTDARPASLLNDDEEYEKDENYDPDSWLNEYDPENLNNGINFIERLRKQVPDLFYSNLIDSILDDNTGITSWLEEDLVEDFNNARKYDDWDVHLAIVSEGSFFPYIEPDYGDNLMMDDFRLYRMYVRNYDEGEIE